MSSAGNICFDGFELDAETGELWKHGHRIKVPPKPLRVLTILAESPGRLVTREAIREQLWGLETFVDYEHGLNFCIREIRSALGDNAKTPRFIETLPRRGYRFIAEISGGRNRTHPVISANHSNPAASGASESELAERDRIEAFEHYARARKHFASAGKEALEAARQDFEQAVNLEPRYALAHSGLGAAYALRTISRQDPESLDKAKEHLRRALELDPELAEPYPWLCYVHMRQNEVSSAFEAGLRAIQLQPELVHAHYFLGLAYFCSCETDPANYQQAANHLLNAARVGPQWQPTWFVLSFVALLNGDYRNAEKFARQLLDRKEQAGLPFIGAEIVLASVKLRCGDPQAARNLLVDFLERLTASDHMYRDSMGAVASCVLGDIEMRDGRTAEALAAYRRAWHAVQEHPMMIAQQRISSRAQAGLASAYAAQGDPERAMGLLSKALHTANNSESAEYNAAGASLAELFWSLAVAYVRMGDTKPALLMLARSVNAGWRDIVWLETDPELHALSAEPQFAALLNEVRSFPKVDLDARN